MRIDLSIEELEEIVKCMGDIRADLWDGMTKVFGLSVEEFIELHEKLKTFASLEVDPDGKKD